MLDLTWSQLNSFNSCSAAATSRGEEWRCGGEEREEEEEDDNKGRRKRKWKEECVSERVIS